MDKIAMYEEAILNSVFEKEAEEDFVDAVADRVIEKMAATKYKEMLAGGDLSGKTERILKFNQKDGRFDKPMFAEGSRVATPFDKKMSTPTRNIIGAKLGIGDNKAMKASQGLEARRDAMVNKGLNMSFGKSHGEKNMTSLNGHNTGMLRYN